MGDPTSDPTGPDLATAAQSERWHLTEHGALLYGDDTGGITVAGLDAWKESPERAEAIRALARWCDEAIESAAALAAAAGPAPVIRVSTSPFCTCGHEHRHHDRVRGCSWMACECPGFDELKGQPLDAGSAPNPQGTDEPTDDDLPVTFTGPDASQRALAWLTDDGQLLVSDDDLAELRRLLAAATPGPWEWQDGDWPTAVSAPNRTLISAMHHALPGLLAEVERLRAAAPASEDGGWLKACIADELDDYLPDAVAYQWADPIARELVHRLPHVFAGQLTAQAIADAIDEAQRRCADTYYPVLTAGHLAALAAGVAELVRASAGSPPPTPDRTGPHTLTLHWEPSPDLDVASLTAAAIDRLQLLLAEAGADDPFVSADQPPTPAPTRTEHLLGSALVDAAKGYRDLAEAVMRKVEDGGSLLDVIEVAVDYLDGRDYLDDDSIALFERAKAAVEVRATGDQP